MRSFTRTIRRVIRDPASEGSLNMLGVGLALTLAGVAMWRDYQAYAVAVLGIGSFLIVIGGVGLVLTFTDREELLEMDAWFEPQQRGMSATTLSVVAPDDEVPHPVASGTATLSGRIIAKRTITLDRVGVEFYQRPRGWPFRYKLVATAWPFGSQADPLGALMSGGGITLNEGDVFHLGKQRLFGSDNAEAPTWARSGVGFKALAVVKLMHPRETMRFHLDDRS